MPSVCGPRAGLISWSSIPCPHSYRGRATAIRPHCSTCHSRCSTWPEVVANLILHHPRRHPFGGREFCSGQREPLLGFVNVVLELCPFRGSPPDQARRRLVGLSHYRATPRYRVYEWVAGTPEFKHLSDVFPSHQENWETVKAILTSRSKAPPAEKSWRTGRSRARRRPRNCCTSGSQPRRDWSAAGSGTRKEPYRFRLPSEMDAFELPPLEQLSRYL